ncbi:MAG TPA: M67 family metallopeptidase [Candidatus Dormibacteraeota bacterium]|nr:M67 family metallopeptidase [Candidatus Dormibacteraeota bacterium]
MVVRLTGTVAAELRRLAAEAYPHEGCGVLVGSAGAPGGDVAVLEATAGHNLRADRARDRYELDPGDIVAAERSARARGLDIVGFWHSHPDHPARPSQVDTSRAWPDYVYVIAATSPAGAGDVRAWVLGGEGEGFLEAQVSGDGGDGS